MIKLSHFDRTFATHFLNIDAFNDTIQSVNSTRHVKTCLQIPVRLSAFPLFPGFSPPQLYYRVVLSKYLI